MSKLKRQVVCVLAILFLISSFTGCSNETKQEGTNKNTANNEPIKISMTWWGDTKRNEVYNKVIDEFQAKNPNIKVDRPFGTWGQYFDKLSTQIAGGNAPDVIGMHQRYAAEYAARGALYDLKLLADKGYLDLKNIPDSVQKSGYVNGKFYMIPQGITGTGVGYNTSTFDKLGVSYPKMDWTWDEFVTKLKEVKTAADSKGMKMWASADFSNDIYNFSIWARANGQHLFTDDGKLGFTEDTVVSWFKFWKDLRDQKLIPDGATTTEYANLPLEQSMFATNKVAIAGVPASQIGLYQNQVKDKGEINIVRFPHIQGQPNPEYISGAFFTINAKSKHPEAAAKLVNFFINDTEGQKTFKIEQGVPAATTAVQSISSLLSKPELKSVDFIQNQLIKNASYEPYPPEGYNEISTNFNKIATAVSFNQETPEKGAADFMKAATDILSKN